MNVLNSIFKNQQLTLLVYIYRVSATWRFGLIANFCTHLLPDYIIASKYGFLPISKLV